MPHIEAKFEDGFVLNEKKQNDVSIYDDRRNTFYDILNKLCEVDHGKMISFTLVLKDLGYDNLIIDWTEVPDNAKPIRYKSYEIDTNNGQIINEQRLVKIGFGYEYFDKSLGKNVQKVQVIS